MNFLDSPIGRYLIVSVVSLIAAVLLFILGGSLAEITGNQFLGFGVKAAGPIAGFLIIFLMSDRALRRTPAVVEPLRSKLHVFKTSNNFTENDGNTYTCTAMIYNSSTNKEQRLSAITRWEAGYLTIDFMNLSSNDWIGAEIRNQANQVWLVHYFDPKANTKEVRSEQ